MIQLANNQKITSTVLNTIAEASGQQYDAYDLRCGTWGKSIGNAWAITSKELFTKYFKILPYIAVDGWEDILLSAKNSYGHNIFINK